MIKWILFVLVVEGGGVTQLSEFDKKEDCFAVAGLLNTHPETEGKMYFACNKMTKV